MGACAHAPSRHAQAAGRDIDVVAGTVAVEQRAGHIQGHVLDAGIERAHRQIAAAHAQGHRAAGRSRLHRHAASSAQAQGASGRAAERQRTGLAQIGRAGACIQAQADHLGVHRVATRAHAACRHAQTASGDVHVVTRTVAIEQRAGHVQAHALAAGRHVNHAQAVARTRYRQGDRASGVDALRDHAAACTQVQDTADRAAHGQGTGLAQVSRTGTGIQAQADQLGLKRIVSRAHTARGHIEAAGGDVHVVAGAVAVEQRASHIQGHALAAGSNALSPNIATGIGDHHRTAGDDAIDRDSEGLDRANGQCIGLLDIGAASAHLQGQRIHLHGQGLGRTAHTAGGSDQQALGRDIGATAQIDQFIGRIEHHHARAGLHLPDLQIGTAGHGDAFGRADRHAAGHAQITGAAQLGAAADADARVEHQMVAAGASMRPAQIARAADARLRPVGDGRQRHAIEAHPVNGHRRGAAQAGASLRADEQPIGPSLRRQHQ